MVTHSWATYLGYVLAAPLFLLAMAVALITTTLYAPFDVSAMYYKNVEPPL